MYFKRCTLFLNKIEIMQQKKRLTQYAQKTLKPYVSIYTMWCNLFRIVGINAYNNAGRTHIYEIKNKTSILRLCKRKNG